MLRNILLCWCAVIAASAQDDPVSYVNPFIGTGQGAPAFNMGNGTGNTPPGAAYPFGMVLWSPDTTTQSGGYRYDQNSIRGFSLTHFSGRGISCWQDLPIMPVTGGFSQAPVTFSHDRERVAPGYYGVALDNGVNVELTVTQRTGLGRFTFPVAGQGTLLVKSGGSANGNWGNTWIKMMGDRGMYGAATSGNCGGVFSYTVYYVLLFDQPFTSYGTWNADTVTPGSLETTGDGSGAYATFDTASNPVVHVRVGLSFVSFTNAYSNLLVENFPSDFDSIRQKATAVWNARLGAIRVQDNDSDPSVVDRKTIFYTALYHASIHPSTFSDANGDYLGFDGAIHHTDRVQYHNIPTWDFYRSLVPLLAITAPDVAGDLAQSLVNAAQQDPGGGIPRWVHAASDSCGMFGDGGPKVLATAYAFGARNFDARAGLNAMMRGATVVGATSAGCPVREGLDDYLKLGYVSTSTWGSVSRTLEYESSDFAIAQMSAALGDLQTYQRFLKRAQNWRNLLHDGYFVPRSSDGTFQAGFSPDGCVSDGFIEGSGGQYAFMVRFNEQGLFNALGGNSKALARLDRHFQQLNAGPCSEFAFMGNEVSLKTPWMYAFAGAPWKTQQVVRRIMAELYSNTPGGLPGNDDGGVLSAWYVLAAIGLYPQISGVSGFVISTPMFPQIDIRLSEDRQIHISAGASGADHPYIQAARLNGQDYFSAWMPWTLLSSGAAIDFVLGESPNEHWATQADLPSFDAQ